MVFRLIKSKLKSNNKMENQTTSSKSIMLNYGLYLGLASILIQLIIYVSGMTYDQPWWVQVLGLLVSIALVFMGTKAFRTNNNELLSFGEGLKVGVGISLVSAIIGVIYQQIFINFIEPDFMSNSMEVARQQMAEQNLTSEQIDAAMQMSEGLSSPLATVGFTLIGALFVGFIISLFTTLILKKGEE
jgi:hypothetical protein